MVTWARLRLGLSVRVIGEGPIVSKDLRSPSRAHHMATRLCAQRPPMTTPMAARTSLLSGRQRCCLPATHVRRPQVTMTQRLSRQGNLLAALRRMERCVSMTARARINDCKAHRKVCVNDCKNTNAPARPSTPVHKLCLLR